MTHKVSTFSPRKGFLSGEGGKDWVFWTFQREGKRRARFHKPFSKDKTGKD